MRLEASAISPVRVKARPLRKGGKSLRAPFALRCGAILIDYIILVSILACSTLVARMFGGGARTAGSSSETIGKLITILVAVLNLGVLPGLTGLTIGKWSTGLRIEPRDGGQLGVGRAVLRHFVGYSLSFITFGLGFLMGAFSPRGRTLHDLIAGTIIVREGPGVSRESASVLPRQRSNS